MQQEKFEMNLANGRVCPNKFLADMAESENPYVRMSAALNPHTDKTLLEKLCCDESPDVRYITASSTYLPVHLLWKLKNDENPHVRWRAEVTLVKLGVIRQVC